MIARLRAIVERAVRHQHVRAVEADRRWRELRDGSHECQGADFSHVAAVLAKGVEEHIRRDQMSPVSAAVFRSRGGHAPGERCPSETAPEPVHATTCDLFADGECCTCGAER